tara:strand:- start:9566 stop:9760 length:195 start_codon:yes stop_codon:yes gene_type:complete
LNFPGISYALLVFLDEAIPERCPAPSDSSTEVMFYAGQRQTVRMLIERFKDENNIDSQDDWKQR